MARATTVLKGFERNVQNVSRSISGIAGFAGIAFSIRAVVEETKRAEQASAKLNAVLKATGSTAGVTRVQLDALAEGMSKGTLFDDDAIRNAQALLLTFRNVQGQTFKDGIALAGDMATVFGTDLQSAIVQVGKALNSPKE